MEQVPAATRLTVLPDTVQTPSVVDVKLTPKPELAEAYFGLGNVFRQLGKLDEARDAYQSAVRLKPDYAWARQVAVDAVRG